MIAHDDVADELLTALRDVFDRLPIGDPTADGTLVGPLINEVRIGDGHGARGGAGGRR